MSIFYGNSDEDLANLDPAVDLSNLSPEAAEIVQRMNRISNPGEMGQRGGQFTGPNFNSGADTVRQKYGMSPQLNDVRNARNTNPYMSSHGDTDPTYRFQNLFSNAGSSGSAAELDAALLSLGSKIDLVSAANSSDDQIQGLLSYFNVPMSVESFRDRYTPDVDRGVASLVGRSGPEYIKG